MPLKDVERKEGKDRYDQLYEIVERGLGGPGYGKERFSEMIKNLLEEIPPLWQQLVKRLCQDIDPEYKETIEGTLFQYLFLLNDQLPEVKEEVIEQTINKIRKNIPSSEVGKLGMLLEETKRYKKKIPTLWKQISADIYSLRNSPFPKKKEMEEDILEKVLWLLRILEDLLK